MLSITAANGQEAMIALLFEKKAEVGIEDKADRTALQVAADAATGGILSKQPRATQGILDLVYLISAVNMQITCSLMLDGVCT